jgi:NADPH:quinone reductase-like Zn-dependent oxidoreductase
MPVNTAAWLSKKRASLEVKTAPYTAPRENEIVVRNHAVAINPADWIKQCSGDFLFSWIKYPFVLGTDLAGEIVQVGSGVTRFNVGDRVLANAVGIDKKRNNAAEGAFQNYTVVLGHMAAPIPNGMTYESAAVLPLGLSTAACGLFEKNQLALQYPSEVRKPTGKTLLVWGGSTSVGSNAIQLAVAAGYEVITTASPRNFAYVKQLGASQAFDYNSKTVRSDVIKAFTGKTTAGAFAVGTGSAEACLAVLDACQGDKFVAMATFPISFQRMSEGANIASEVLRQAPKLMSFNAHRLWKSLTKRTRSRFIFASSLTHNEVSRVIYVDFLPRALADGRYIPAPKPRVVGHGLSAIQSGFDIQMKGVSAEKIVIAL